jgi:enoyl reductase-like protein
MSKNEAQESLNKFLKERGWNVEVNLECKDVDVTEISDRELLERVVDLALFEYDIRWEGTYNRVLFQELNDRLERILKTLEVADDGNE